MAIYSIYYMKPEFFRDGRMGYDWLRDNKLLPDPTNLTRSHVFLTLLEARNPEEVYSRMQGENWSLAGEARRVTTSKGLRHISMSVGDIVVEHHSRVAYIVDRMGFRFLGKVATVGEG